jgi:long-chain acyl-CoA synthetase
MPDRVINDRPGLLLTGATGFLGGELLARLLERDSRPVYALVRAGSDEEAAARLDGVIESLLGGAEPWAGRAVAVAADVAQPGLGLSAAKRAWLAERVDGILHCAATVSFTLGLDASRATNVDGTRRLLDFAELSAGRGSFDCFTYVSTAYVAGDHGGDFGERQLKVGQGFRNAYERSKFEAELLVREREGDVPVQVVRPSIVVGDSRTGWTPAFNVLYTPLRAFTKGVYPVIPARRSSPVDVVPVDYVADALLALAGQPGTTYHLTAGERTSSVGELIELAADYLERRPPRVLSPSLYRRAVHPLLLRRAGQARERALRRTEVFFPYFSMRVCYDNTLAREALAEHGIEAPPLSAYFERLMDFALSAEWGRSPLPRHQVVPVPRRSRRPRLERRGSRQDYGRPALHSLAPGG